MKIASIIDVEDGSTKFCGPWKRTNELRWHEFNLQQKWVRKFEHVGHGFSDKGIEEEWRDITND